MNKPDNVALKSTVGTGPVFMLVLILISACGPFAMQIFLPALPALKKAFDVTTGAVQLTISLSMLTIAIATLFYGPLSDRLGRHPMVLAGVGLFMLGTAICYLAPSLPVLILGRLIQSAGGAAGIVLSRSIARDLYGDGDAARIIGYLTIAMVVAPLVSPALGGMLVDAFSWRAIFLTTGVLALIIIVLVLIYLGETHVQKGPPTSARQRLADMLSLLRHRRYMGYALQTGVQTAVFYAFLSAAPYLMATTLKRPATEYGVMFALLPGSFILGTFIGIRLTRKLALPVIITRAVWAVFIALLPAAALTHFLPLSPWTLFGSAAFIAVLQGMVVANAQAAAVNTAAHIAGAASGLSGFFQMAISAIAAQIVGSLNDGTVVPMLIVMLVAAFLGLLLLPMIQEKHPPGQTAAP